MKRIAILLFSLFLFTSCIVLNVYEAPKTEQEPPKRIHKKHMMIPSELTIPLQEGDKQILFFGDENPPLPETIQIGDSIKIHVKKGDKQKKRIMLFQHSEKTKDSLNMFVWKSDQEPTANLEPVIVVNGVEMIETFRMDRINPDQIERVDILKGPAAIKFLGEKGARGVIRITTKKK